MSVTKEISIAGTKFTISTPYVEGATITAAEAKVLNQTRAENIGNNFRAAVKEEMAKENFDLTKIMADIAAYDAEYAFTLSNATRTPVDPLEAECLRIARVFVKTKLAEAGHKSLKDYLAIEGNEAKYDAALDKVSALDETVKLAKKALADKAKVKSIASEELGL